jgi:GAF domain-containing protein
MAEELFVDQNLDREAQYQSLLPQIEALVADEPDLIANLSNIAAALKQTFGFFWIGFYLVKADELVLGPFQGPVACTRIGRGKGVCGSAWEQKKTLIVPDVEAFPGHIACNGASRSEIVVPILKDGEVVMVLDIDSDQLDDFSKKDELYLEKLSDIIFSDDRD